MNKQLLVGIALGCSLLGSVHLQADQSTSYTYNGLGQVLTSDGSRTDVTDVTTYTYDASGNVATVTNALSHLTQFTSYDGAGRPLTIIDSNGVTTTLTYTSRGWLESSTVNHAGGNAVTSYDYDLVGQITAIILPDGGTLIFEYDDAGRLIAIQNSITERIEYTLDNAGNRTDEVIKNDIGVIQKNLTRPSEL